MTVPDSNRQLDAVHRGRELAVVASALAVFGLLLAYVLTTGSSPGGVDATLHDWALHHRPETMVHVAAGVTRLGQALIDLPLLFLGAITVTPGALRSRVQEAVLATLVLATGLFLRAIVASLIGRPRPPVADWATAATGYAFPSGHTTGATITAVLLGWMILRRADWRSSARAILCILAVVAAVTVGLTRVYLGVHWPSDVIGGWAFGVAWSSLGSSLTARLKWLR